MAAKSEKKQLGRPRKIKSPEEMDALVDSYVKLCQNPEAPKAITLTGLILHLGLSSRESLDEYYNYDGFSDSVKRAKLLIEHEYEQRLIVGTNAAAPIFALKNFGWKDKVETKTEIAGSVDMSVTMRPSVTKEEWMALHGLGTAIGRTE